MTKLLIVSCLVTFADPQKTSMRTSWIITTYNRPNALRLVLDSVKQQTILPTEVVIADDGSTEDTYDFIEEYRKSFPIPLLHAWQEDKGFRAARSRNKAVAMSSGEYLIFTDGDLILHPKFLESHLRMAKKGRLLSGGRTLLSTKLTTKLLTEKRSPSFWNIVLSSGNKHNSFHHNLLARLFTHVSNTASNMKGGNKSIYREDFERLNGLNEAFVGWGFEDSEFAVRAIRSGMTKYKLRYCAVTYHLDHGEDNLRRSGDLVKVNRALLKKSKTLTNVRCEQGLDSHRTSPITEYQA